MEGSAGSAPSPSKPAGYPALSHVLLHDNITGTALFPKVEFVFEDDEIPSWADQAICVGLDQAGNVREVKSAQPSLKIGNFHVSKEIDGSETLHVEGSFPTRYEATKSFSRNVRDLYEELEMRNKFIRSLLLDETKPGGLLSDQVELSECLKKRNSFPEIRSPNPSHIKTTSKEAPRVTSKTAVGSEEVFSMRGSPDAKLDLHTQQSDEGNSFSASTVQSELLKDMVLQFHRKRSLSPPNLADDPFQPFPFFNDTPRNRTSRTPSLSEKDGDQFVAGEPPFLDVPSSPTSLRMPKVCLSPYKDNATPRSRPHGLGHSFRNSDSPPPISVPLVNKFPRILGLDILPPASPPPVLLPGSQPPRTAIAMEQNTPQPTLPTMMDEKPKALLTKKQVLEEEVHQWMSNGSPTNEDMDFPDDLSPPQIPRNPTFPQIIAHGKQPVRMQSAPSFGTKNHPLFLPDENEKSKTLGNPARGLGKGM